MKAVREVMLVLYVVRHKFSMLMVEDKKVSSCVNYRWVNGGECERKKKWRQWSAKEKSTAGIKNVFVMKRRESQAG